MKTKLLSLAAVAALAIGFATSGAHAQSSKFAAAYDTDGVVLAHAYACVDGDGGCADDNFDWDVGFAAHLANIKAPQGKELLIGLSAVPILLTYTEAKGKNGGEIGESVALAGVGMAVRYAHHDDLPPNFNAGDVCFDPDSETAKPGIVPLSVRLQYLSVKSALTITDLTIEGDITVGLGLATAASHHFNFLAPDLDQSGNHAVAACFVGGAVAALIGETEGKSLAVAALGKRMMTVQEVRAIQSADFEVDSVEIGID